MTTELPLLDERTFGDVLALGGDDDPTFVGDLVADYLHQAGLRLESIELAITRSDAAAARFNAHALKSCSVSVGGVELAALSARIEEYARAGELRLAARVLPALFGAAHRLHVELERRCADLGRSRQ